MEKVNKQKTKTGTVISNKMQKTVVVMVERKVQHSKFKKIVKQKKKFMAHDENNQCNVGDQVEIMETRPLSANKRWKIVRVIAKSKVHGLAEIGEVAA